MTTLDTGNPKQNKPLRGKLGPREVVSDRPGRYGAAIIRARRTIGASIDVYAGRLQDRGTRQ